MGPRLISQNFTDSTGTLQSRNGRNRGFWRIQYLQKQLSPFVPSESSLISLRSAFQLAVQTRPEGQNKPAVVLIVGERAES